MIRDVRFAFRALRRCPGFAVTALLLLSIGIGAVGAALALPWRRTALPGLRGSPFLVAAAFAAGIPALRAAPVDPMKALHAD